MEKKAPLWQRQDQEPRGQACRIDQADGMVSVQEMSAGSTSFAGGGEAIYGGGTAKSQMVDPPQLFVNF